jgi:hypothetical protein
MKGFEMDEIWKSWTEFNGLIRGKDIVFFGVAPDWWDKTFQSSDPNLSYIVDNSETRIDTSFFVSNHYGELEVKNPMVLKKKADNVFVVITSGAYHSIYPQLVSYGLVPGRDFCCTPALNNLRIIADINSHTAKVLICSSDHKIYSDLDDGKTFGGGLYLFDTSSRELKKVLDGTFHEILDIGDRYIILDEIKGVLEVSKEFEVIHEFGFEMGSRSHGVAYCPDMNLVFIAKSGLDKISVYDAKTYELQYDIELSEKNKKLKQEQHHINDICVKDRYLYVSIFSHSGNYPRGFYDGGIFEIDLDDISNRRILVNNAWMPHSIKFFGKNMHYVDSMNSILYQGDKKILGEFSGFIRGIDFDKKYYYVGQSESRYFDRLAGIKNYISMNAGFYLFDADSKAGKFFGIPQLRQIRSLLVLDK